MNGDVCNFMRHSLGQHCVWMSREQHRIDPDTIYLPTRPCRENRLTGSATGQIECDFRHGQRSCFHRQNVTRLLVPILGRLIDRVF